MLKPVCIKVGLTLFAGACLCGGIQAHSLNGEKEDILNTMKSATRYMMDSVSYRGGFVWNYLPDLSRSWGEMEAKRTMVWIQPPGTPSVGHLLLDAYHATGDKFYYEAAEKVANVLIWGQLECGGWNYVFDFAGENSLKEWYETVGKSGWRLEEFRHYYGNATYDDLGTISAAKFLLRMYVEKNDPAYKAPLEKVIHFILESQYPVGGWPQRYPLRYDHPFEGKEDYSSFITLNDDVTPEIIDFLIQCYQAMGLQNIKEPIMRAMYLTITLQQGEPYAGWADQYTVTDLKPAHARSYEPRSVNTGTTVGMIYQMMEYIKFLESQKLPETEVRKWHRKSDNPDEILVPRFIDPDTGKPLYVHRKGGNIYNGKYYIDQNIENTIAHYSSATFVNPEQLRKDFDEVKKIDKNKLLFQSPLLSDELCPLPKYYTHCPRLVTEKEISNLMAQVKKQGYWLSDLPSTSHPYRCGWTPDLSGKEDYSRKMVGDDFDTSPYPCTDGQQCISVAAYIKNMMALIAALEGNVK